DQLLPHALAAAAVVAEFRIGTVEAGNVLNRTGVYLHEHGHYTKAAPLFQLAAQIRKRALGDTHPDYGSSLHNLATTYLEQGDYLRAEPLLRQALEIARCSS